MGNQSSGLSNFLPFMAIFTDPEKFKSMKQQLKAFHLRLRQFNIFYWTRLQNQRSTTINASQMMMISIHRTIESFPSWQVSTSHHAFLLKSTKISINGSQAHIERTFEQCAMQLLATNFISAIVQFFQYLLLFNGQALPFFCHSSPSSLIPLRTIVR